MIVTGLSKGGVQSPNFHLSHWHYGDSHLLKSVSDKGEDDNLNAAFFGWETEAERQIILKTSAYLYACM